MTSVSVSRERETSFPVPYFSSKYLNFTHPLVVTFDCPVWIFVLQLHSEERPRLEIKEGAPQSRVNEAFHCPDLSVVLFFPRHDFRFCAMQHRIHPRHGVVPTKAKRRQQLFGSTGG